MKYLLLLLSVYLSGCGRSLVISQYIHPDFRDYTNDYLYYAKLFKAEPQMDSLSVEYGDLPHEVSGVCRLAKQTGKRINGERYTIYIRMVLINSNSWNRFGEYTKMWVIFHELAHCTLGLGHNDDMLWDVDKEVPKSMLNSYTFLDESFLSENLIYYLKELFTENAPIQDYISSSNTSIF